MLFFLLIKKFISIKYMLRKSMFLFQRHRYVQRSGHTPRALVSSSIMPTRPRCSHMSYKALTGENYEFELKNDNVRDKVRCERVRAVEGPVEGSDDAPPPRPYAGDNPRSYQ